MIEGGGVNIKVVNKKLAFLVKKWPLTNSSYSVPFHWIQLKYHIKYNKKYLQFQLKITGSISFVMLELGVKKEKSFVKSSVVDCVASVAYEVVMILYLLILPFQQAP